MRKRLRQREKKRKPGLFKLGKTILEIGKYAWRCEFCSFKLFDINCMAISCKIRKLEKKLCRKLLLKIQIDIETLLQEVSINMSQTYQHIENGLIMMLYKQAQTPSA